MVAKKTVVYILRGWQEPAQPVGTWRFRLEDPRHNCHRSFSSLQELQQFLQTQFDEDAAPNHKDDEHEI